MTTVNAAVSLILFTRQQSPIKSIEDADACHLVVLLYLGSSSHRRFPTFTFRISCSHRTCESNRGSHLLLISAPWRWVKLLENDWSYGNRHLLSTPPPFSCRSVDCAHLPTVTLAGHLSFNTKIEARARTRKFPSTLPSINAFERRHVNVITRVRDFDDL